MPAQQMGHSASEGALGASTDPKLTKLRAKYNASGANYFKNSAVKSSAGFYQTCGMVLAKPYKSKASKTKIIPASEKVAGKSEYGQQFTEKRYCYSSMDNKPLVKYDPLAYRSRNAIPDITSGAKNASNVVFDQGLFFVKKRQFVTSTQNYLTGDPPDPRTNPGILAEKCRLTRYHREQ